MKGSFIALALRMLHVDEQCVCVCGSGMTCGRCCFKVSMNKAFLFYPDKKNMLHGVKTHSDMENMGKDCVCGSGLTCGRCGF